MKWIVYGCLVLLAAFRVASERELRERAYDWCAARERGGKLQLAVVRGTLGNEVAGRTPLDDPEIPTAGGRWIAFSGSVSIPRPNGSDFGRRIRISGLMRCTPPFRNPGRTGDGLWQLAPPRVTLGGSSSRLALEVQKESLPSRIRKGFSSWLKRVSASTPGLLAFERAVWMGDLSGLPESLRTLFRDGGLAAILALSGQHVTCFLLVLFAIQKNFLRLVWRWLPRSWFCLYPIWCESLPVMVSALLFILSGGAPPIARTLAMASSVWLLRRRQIHCSTLQLTTSGVALLLVADPGLADSASFFLSAFGTGLTAGVLTQNRSDKRFQMYLVGATILPVLAWPLSAFLFGKVSWTAPLHNILLSWLWELILIPCGFVLPFFMSVLPLGLREWLGQYLEQGWGGLIKVQQWLGRVVPPIYTACPRPSWGEWIVLEILLISIFSSLVLRRFSRAAQYES